MSRPSLIRSGPPQAACRRPAHDSYLNHSLGWGIPLALSGVEGSQERNRRGLLPSPPHINTHYKRCPKALRLRLRSDQSPSRPQHGRSPDKSRHALSRGHCQVRAPLTRRKGIAPSGDAPEHGVIVLPWAIAPLSDSAAADLARQSEQSDERRLKTNAPFLDSTVVTIGELRSTNAGLGSPLLSLGMVEHFWWSRPHRESFSRLFHIPSEVRGCRRAVADVKPPLRRTTPIGTMAGHFWWSRAPHSETSSFLFHVLSEVRGCRRVVADVNRLQGRTTRIATGVADIMRNRPGPSITSPTHNPTHPSPTIGGHPCPEEAVGPAPAHPKETTTLSSTAETPVASGNSPTSLPSFPPPAALYKATPTKPGSHQPSHSPPLWTAFPSTPFVSPTPLCRNSTIPLRPSSPPDPNGPGKSPLMARSRPKLPRKLKVFRKIIKIHP